MNNKSVLINGRGLTLSNLDKDLYPSWGFTKAQILDYYSRASKFILPHLQNRAVTLKRYPNGVDKDFFYEKRCPSHRPAWMSTALVPYGGRKTLVGCVVSNLEGLLWVENLASIELHVPLARASSPHIADWVVFDLDPGQGATVLECAEVASVLRKLLEDLGLRSFVKTSGKKGLHVCVPLNSGTPFESTKSFSRATALTMQKNYPSLVTAKIGKEFRSHRVFINWAQNDPSKTTVCVYSLRAEEKPTVSFPLSWNELETARRQKKSDRLVIVHSEALARLEKHGDLFREILNEKQKLPYV